MATPVVGPVTSIINTPTLYIYKNKYTQAKPIDRPLPYKLRHFTTLPGSFYPGRTAGSWSVSSDYRFPTIRAQCYSKAYERFKDNMKSQASIGVALAELSQSMKMIHDRAVQLTQFTIALQKGRLGDAAAILSTPIPKKAKVRRKVADNWLEYHFGWSPLIKDLYNAIDVLTRPIDPIYASGSATVPIAWKDVTSGGMAGNSRTQLGFHQIKLGGLVTVTNPNLHLASSLGLANPFTIAFELIPWSFVGDWFFNFEQVLSSMTDFLGLSLSQAYTTDTTKAKWLDSSYNNFWPPTAYSYGIFGVDMTRNTGIASPSFTIRPFKVWGWKRSLTAISLLTQKTSRISNSYGH